MILTGDSPEAARVLEALGNSTAKVKSINVRIAKGQPILVTVERYVGTDAEEMDALADMLEYYALTTRLSDDPPPGEPRDGPADRTHYDPQEFPTRYPLELTPSLHVCLWSDDGSFKWTVGLWQFTKEGPEFRFVGDRPLDCRVDWAHLREIIAQGQRMAEQRVGQP